MAGQMRICSDSKLAAKDEDLMYKTVSSLQILDYHGKKHPLGFSKLTRAENRKRSDKANVSEVFLKPRHTSQTSFPSEAVDL